MRNAPVACGLAAAVLYALTACSNPPPSLKTLAVGPMAKLTPTAAPAPEAPATPFVDAGGAAHTLSEFKGKVTVVNLWANWCAPCKAEIPSLAKLAEAYKGKDLAVVPISVGKGKDEEAGRAFIARNAPLPFYSEPAYKLVYAFKPPVEDMPTTVIYDRRGVERARLVAGADWSSPQARAVVDYLLAER